jgi:hypothetical protein
VAGIFRNTLSEGSGVIVLAPKPELPGMQAAVLACL